MPGFEDEAQLAPRPVTAEVFTGNSLISPASTNGHKFAVTGLTPVRSELVAPYTGEFPLVLECRLLHTLEIGIHTQFIGEIVDVKADLDTLSDDGFPDILKRKPLIFDTAHKGYHPVGPLLSKAFSIGKKLL